MAVYSVWNVGKNSYDYYEAPGKAETHATAPNIIQFGGIGVSSNEAAWKLPFGARKVGQGELPKGKIASSGMAGLGDDAPSSTKIGLLLVAAYLGWRYLR